MNLVKLGRSDILIPRLAIGTWQACGWVSSDEQKIIQVIRYGLDHGFNFIDTAESYGDGSAEEIVRKAVDKNRHNVVIATKFSHKNSTPEKARKALELSLRRLKTDYIDLYQYHWPSATTPLADTISALRQFKKEGKIRAIGVSNWMEPEWEEFNSSDDIDSCQNCYNLLWRNTEKNVQPYCRENNITFLAYSPVAQGILAGKVLEPGNLPPDSRRQNVLLNKENFENIEKILNELRSMANIFGCTMSQLALAWILRSPNGPVPILGCSNVEQFKENIKCLELSLSSPDYQKLSELTNALALNRDPHDSLWGWHPRSKKK